MSKKSTSASPRKTAATAAPKKTTPKRAARSTLGSASESVLESEPLLESEFVQTALTLRVQGNSSDWQPKPAQKAPARSTKVHDFSGYVVFALPSELKETLGEAVFNKCMADLENHEVIAIHREKDSITYVRMRCVAQMYTPPREATVAGKTSQSSKGRTRSRV